MEVNKENLTEKVYLFLMSSETYLDSSSDIIKDLGNSKICYVTLNKTASVLKGIFSKRGIDTKDIIFIDAISKSMMDVEEEGSSGIYYVGSPSALTELAIMIDDFIKKDFDYLIFDSLNTLLVYRDKQSVERFVRSTINKIRQSDIRAIFYALDVDAHQEMINQCCVLVDEVIKLKK